MSSKNPPIKARVIVPYLEGHNGPYFLAKCEIGTVSVSLNRDVWQEDERLRGGISVLLEDICEMYGRGWRANRARFYRPGDEKFKGESPEGTEGD